MTASALAVDAYTANAGFTFDRSSTILGGASTGTMRPARERHGLGSANTLGIDFGLPGIKVPYRPEGCITQSANFLG
jgi:hypothetical protein